MPFSLAVVAQFSFKVGQTPWSAADAPVGLLGLDRSLANGGSRGTRADQGGCPTISVQFSALVKLSGIEQACLRHVGVDLWPFR
jgi:hypothetical protein